MGAVTGDARPGADAAHPDFAGVPVDPAAPRAQGAAAEQAAADFGLPLELTAGVQAGGTGHGDSPPALGNSGGGAQRCESLPAGRGSVHRRTGACGPQKALAATATVRYRTPSSAATGRGPLGSAIANGTMRTGTGMHDSDSAPLPPAGLQPMPLFAPPPVGPAAADPPC